MKLNRTASLSVKIVVVTAIAVGVHIFFRVVSPPAEVSACEHSCLCEKYFAEAASIEASSDAKLANLTTNLQSIRAQLELYRLHHNGKYPENIVDGLTKKTTPSGEVDAAGAFGPYMSNFPANPFVEDEEKAVKTSGKPGEGWSYNPPTGSLRANTPGHEGL